MRILGILAAVAMAAATACTYQVVPDRSATTPSFLGAETDPCTDGGAAPDGGATCSADLSSDPDNCGQCGHGCLGGACNDGVCQPVHLVRGEAGPRWVGVHAGQVYFASSSNIKRMPASGGNVTVFANDVGGWNGTASTITQDASGLFYAGASYLFVWRAYEDPYYLVWDASTPVVAVTTDTANAYVVDSQGSLRRIPKNGYESIAPIGNAAGFTASLVADDTYVYAAGQGGIRRWPSDGSAAGTTGSLLTSTPAGSLAIDAGYVYFTTPGGVTRISKATGTLSIVAANVDMGPADSAGSVGNQPIAVDAVRVYFASQRQGNVLACPLAGCSGDPTVLAENQPAPYAIAVDDGAVYWTTLRGNAVLKVAK